MTKKIIAIKQKKQTLKEFEDSIKGFDETFRNQLVKVYNNELTTLALSENQIGAEGASALAAGLKENTSLKNLSLKVNQIGDEGAT